MPNPWHSVDATARMCNSSLLTWGSPGPPGGPRRPRFPYGRRPHAKVPPHDHHPTNESGPPRPLLTRVWSARLACGSAILFVVGGVIGTGIFLTTGEMAAIIPRLP